MKDTFSAVRRAIVASVAVSLVCGTSPQAFADAPAGITPTTVTVGNVAVLSGPVPGLFQGAPFGVEAYFAYVNSTGGVYGRQLKVDGADDTLDCNRNKASYEALADHVFAFVGSFSVFDSCGATVLAQHENIPEISTPFDAPTYQKLTNHFSPRPQPPGYQYGALKYYRQKWPNVTKAAIIYGAGAAALSAQYEKSAMESVGYTVAYMRQYRNGEANFTPDIVRMQQEGVGLFDVSLADVHTVSRLLNAAKQQNWHPEIFQSQAAYDGKLLALVDGGAADGVVIPMPNALFLGEDAKTNQAVSTFTAWLQKTHPGFQPDYYSLFGWTSAELFVDALRKAGKNPTQESVMTALRGTHHFDADGLLAPSDPGSGQPPNCYVLVTVRNGKFVREKPGKGLDCSSGGYFYAKT